jgi:hypothetical protein
MISVRYSAVDRYTTTRRYKTLTAARAFAVAMVGAHPETYGNSYAVSDDGVGTVRVTGCTLAELFARPAVEAYTCTAACVFGGPAYMVATEDGPAARCDWFVGSTRGGQDYVLNHTFGSRHEAQALANKVTERGIIDLAHWTKAEPYDREAEAAADWQDEQDDRRAWGA